MCLVLKLDNGKVVSIANEQTESCQHPVPYYNIDIQYTKLGDFLLSKGTYNIMDRVISYTCSKKKNNRNTLYLLDNHLPNLPCNQLDKMLSL